MWLLTRENVFYGFVILTFVVLYYSPSSIVHTVETIQRFAAIVIILWLECIGIFFMCTAASFM